VEFLIGEFLVDIASRSTKMVCKVIAIGRYVIGIHG
jgi:hypothetical protein